MAKILIEWKRGGHAYGSQELNVEGASIGVSEAAPDFGGLPGKAHVTVLDGEVFVSLGASVTVDTGSYIAAGAVRKVRLQPGQTLAFLAAPQSAGSGALASNAASVAFTPTVGRPAYLELTGAGSAVVQLEYECADGVTYAPRGVGTDGGSPIILGKVAYSGSPVALSFETTIAGQSVKARVIGTIAGAGVNFAFRQ